MEHMHLYRSVMRRITLRYPVLVYCSDLAQHNNGTGNWLPDLPFLEPGVSGIGKTTLTKKISSLLSEKGVRTSGFYTEEVRKNRIREGFDVVTLDGTRGRLARDEGLLEVPVRNKVGKYGVLVQEFENVALPCLNKSTDASAHLLVIDEIGKMEFFSAPFKSKIQDVFSPSSNRVVLATLPSRKGDPVIESIRNNRRTKVWMVTRENRNNIHEEIINEMKTTLQCN